VPSSSFTHAGLTNKFCCSFNRTILHSQHAWGVPLAHCAFLCKRDADSLHPALSARCWYKSWFVRPETYQRISSAPCIACAWLWNSALFSPPFFSEHMAIANSVTHPSQETRHSPTVHRPPWHEYAQLSYIAQLRTKISTFSILRPYNNVCFFCVCFMYILCVYGPSACNKTDDDDDNSTAAHYTVVRPHNADHIRGRSSVRYNHCLSLNGFVCWCKLALFYAY